MTSTLKIIIDVTADAAKGELGAIAKDLKATGAAATDASGKLGNLNGGLNDAVKGLTGFDLATVGTTAVVAGLAAGLKYSIAQAAESEKIMAQTAAVIKSTGGAAGLTAAEIEKMAGALQQMSAFDDEAIQKGENLLLTFTNIGRDVFPQATQAMVDMAAAMGTDVSGGAIQLGKALNNPIEGISALTRVGVTFDAEQKALIKTMSDAGDVAGAQRVILAELNKEFGGSAQAQVNTYSGQMALFKNNVDNLAEALGKELLPTLTEAAKAINLLITYNDQIAGAQSEHELAVKKTADTYDEYITEMLRTAVVSGQTQQIWVDMHGDAFTQGTDLDYLKKQWNILTEAQFDAAHSLRIIGDGRKEAQLDRLADDQSMSAKSAQDNAEALEREGKSALGASSGLREVGSAIRDAIDAGAILSAGLSGEVTKAQTDYQAVLDETTPKIDKITAQIKKYEGATGRTVFVQQEATASSADVALAWDKQQVAAGKLADAQQKLGEFTGDNADDLFKLRMEVDAATVAYENSTDALGKASDASITGKDVTLDYTNKLKELHTALDIETAKQQAAEAQLLKTTEQFIFQKISVGLDDAATLKLAESMGLIDPASAAAAQSALNLRKEFDAGRLTAEEFGVGADELAQAIARLQDKHVTITVDSIRNEIINTINNGVIDNRGGGTTSGGGANDNNTGSTGHVDPVTGVWVPGFAAGGSMLIPPGFPNDSFPLRMNVESGEVVTVTPAGQAARGGDTYIINDRMTGALILEQRRQRVLAQHDALMR